MIRDALRKTNAVHYYYTLGNNFRLWYEQFLLKHSPVRYFNFRYKKIFNRKLNLSQPSTFNEKLIWMNLFWKHPLKAECADKFMIRDYVLNRGYGHILPQLLGSYNQSSEIDFEALPQKFVLKCNHGCGFNIICTNKNELDINHTKQLLDSWLNTDYSKNTGELHYACITPRIICEEFLEGPEGKQPTDFKVFCFSGKAQSVLVATDRDETGHTDKYDFYDLNWNKLPYYVPSINAVRQTPKPASFDTMIEIVEALSQPFPFVRMDMYEINGKIILGEMTFTPSGCLNPNLTDQAQNTWGTLIVLPAPVI
jgi:TupA-like ATPgrasp